MPTTTLHDLESERALIGALLIAPHKLAEVDDLAPEDFASPEHRAIWTAVLGLGQNGGVFDAVLIKHRLREAGTLTDRVGEALLIAEESTLSAANLVNYARAVQTKALRRRMSDAADRIGKLATDAQVDAEALRDEAEKLVMAAGEAKETQGPEHFAVAMREAFTLIQSRRDGGTISGVPTGLPMLDKRLGGLQPGQLFILAARPGLGKSSLAMQVAEFAAKAGAGALIFNLEMPKVELALRSMASRARVTQEHLKGRPLAPMHLDELSRMAGEVPTWPLYVDDTASLTVGEIRSRARRMKQRDGRIAVVVVDYLQLISAARGKKHGNRQEEVAEISRGLKLLAKELGVPVIALSQLSRDVEKGNRRPMLADLRESGAIEQDADCVMFIHREGGTEPGNDAAASLPCELIIAKQRNGSSGCIIPLVFQAGFTRFAEAARTWEAA